MATTYVQITLANHLDARSAARLGLPRQEFHPGDQIILASEDARSLAAAGYVAVATVFSAVPILAGPNTWTGAQDFTGATVTGASDKLGLIPVPVKTAAYTASPGDFVPVDTTAGNVPITFPTAPADGTVVAVKHVAQGGANTVSLVLGGSDKFNATSGAATGILTLLNQGMIAQYKAATAVWYGVATDLPLSGLDARYVTPATANATYAPIAGASQQFSLPRVSKKLSAMNSATGRLVTLHFGDSYGQKVPIKLYPLLESIAGGNAGGGLVDGAGSTIAGQMVTSATTGTVTSNLSAYDAWPSGLVQTYSTGATRTYQNTAGQFVGDTIKVYYVLEPGAGTFKIQVDGSDAAGFTNVSAAGTLGQLGIATVSATRGQHTVTVVNLTGTVRIAYLAHYDSTNSGIVTLPVCQGGIALNSAQATAWSNFQAFLADISPDLMTFEMKELSVYGDGTTYAQALAKLFTVTSAGAPGMDVIGIGSPPVSVNDADQVVQNATLRAACSTYGYVFWDSYALFGSYARLVALGWNGDGTHVSTDCDEWRAMLLARDAGLLAVYRRSLDGGNVVSRGVTFARAGDASGGVSSTFGKSRGIIRPEPSFGFDLEVLPGRWTKMMSSDGATELARFDGSGAATPTHFLPDKTRIGGSGNAAIAQDSTTMLSPRRGSALTSRADWAARGCYHDVVTLNGQSGTITLDCSTGTSFVVNLTGDVTTFSFSNAAASGVLIRIAFVQDAIGSRLLNGANASIKWAGATRPTLTTTANRRDSFIFEPTGGGSFFEVGRSMNVG